MKSHYYTESNKELQDERKTFTYHIKKQPYIFQTNSGMFSKDYVDFGTMTLLENFIEPEISGNFLDIGCGYGPIGIFLARNYLHRQVMMVDINERAVVQAIINIELNKISNAKVLKSHLYESISEKFAAIITNPPIRTGKKIVYQIYQEAKKYLLNNGELWLVIQKKQGADSTIKYLNDLFQNCEVIKRNKGYYILRCINIDNSV